MASLDPSRSSGTTGSRRGHGLLDGITVSEEVTSVSDRTLLRPMNEEYNTDVKQRDISLVWRRKRGTTGGQSLFKHQYLSHWGLEIVTPGDLNGYVWELRMDPEDKGVLASAGSLNVPRSGWRETDVRRAFTGVKTTLKDSDIQLHAQIIVATMRRPMLRGSTDEEKYGEYRNNCHRFARSLAIALTEDPSERTKLASFFETQHSFGDKQHDPAPAPNGPENWLTSDAW